MCCKKNIKSLKNQVLLCIVAIVMFVITPNYSFSKFDVGKFIGTRQGLLRLSNFGTDFYFTVPPTYLGNNTNEVSIKLFVFSYSDANVELSVVSKTYKQTMKVKANTENMFEIYPEIAFPEILSTALSPITAKVYLKSGIRLKSDYPVSVYVLVSGTGKGEGFLAMPISSLGNNYAPTSFIEPSTSIVSSVYFPSVVGIVSPFDGNTVTISHSDTTKLGYPIKKMINEGDCFYLYLVGGSSEISGLKINSDKPVSVISGNQLASVPSGEEPVNYLLETEFPSMIWGKYYHIPKNYNREKNGIIKISGNTPNTDVKLNGQVVGTILSSNNPLNYLELRPNTNLNSALDIVSSNHPITVSIYNATYGEETITPDYLLPNKITLVPVEQYSYNLLMNSPETIRKVSNSFMRLILISKINFDGTIPDDFELGRYINGNWVWQPVKNMQLLDKREFKYLFDANRYAQITMNIPFSSIFQIRGSEFVAYLLGSDGNGTFGFTGGINYRNMLSSDYDPPAISYNMTCDGSVKGIANDMPENPTVRTNLNLPIFHSDVSYNYDKVFSSIIPGTSATMNWDLKTRDKSSDAFAVITFRDYSGNDTTIAIEYFAPKITILPSTIDFGNVPLNQKVTETFIIKNYSTEPINIINFPFKIKNGNFKFSSSFQPFTLKSNEEREFSIDFIAAQSGIYEDSIGYNNDCIIDYLTKLIARIGEPKIQAIDINFGQININQVVQGKATISNIGENNLLIYSYKISNSEILSVEFPSGFDQNNPLIIEPNKSVDFIVTFQPNKVQKFTEMITFNSNATGQDNITYISANSVEPGILTSSKDLGKIRLSKSNLPSAILYAKAIRIENSGSVNLTISNIEIDGNSLFKENFSISFEPLINKTLKPKDYFYLDVSFVPKDIGENIVILNFTTKEGAKSSSVISAFVTSPKYKVYSCCDGFDTLLVKSGQESKMTYQFQNLSQSEWEYADTLIIENVYADREFTATTIDEYSSKPFYINLSTFEKEKVLLSGESIFVDVYFSPQDTGLVNSEILFVTNTKDNYEMKLSGYGINRTLSVNDLYMETCVGVAVIGKITIENNSIKEVALNRIQLSNSQNFIINTEIPGDVIIPVKGKYEIEITYLSGDISAQTSELLCFIGAESTPALVALINAKAKKYSIQSDISPISQQAKIGDTVKSKIMISGSSQKLMQFESDYHIVVEYSSDFLRIIPSSVKLGKIFNGKFKIDNIKSNILGKVELDLTCLVESEMLTDGEVINFETEVFLPQTASNKGQINAQIYPKNNRCFEFPKIFSFVNVEIGCGGELQKFITNAEDYFIQGINVIEDREIISLDFGMAYDGIVEISMFDYSGNKVKALVDSYAKKGKYTVDLDFENFSNGIYFLVMKSGEFNYTLKFIKM